MTLDQYKQGLALLAEELNIKAVVLPMGDTNRGRMTFVYEKDTKDIFFEFDSETREPINNPKREMIALSFLKEKMK